MNAHAKFAEDVNHLSLRNILFQILDILFRFEIFRDEGGSKAN